MQGFIANPLQTLRQAGLRAKKSWGQNFLRDTSVLSAIASASGADPKQPVLELGAGMGALTAHLLATGAEVTCIERDRDMLPILRENFADAQNLHLREADAGRFDYARFAAGQSTSLHVVGNLPYQLSGRILVNFADAANVIARAVILIQHEVAERLIADPGGRNYGLLSALVQRRFHASIIRHVPPDAFFPIPKVDSAVVCLQRRQDNLFSDREDNAFVQAARAAFCARRKTLRNALMRAPNLLPRPTSDNALAALHQAQIDPQARAETLSLDDFFRLGRALDHLGHIPEKTTTPYPMGAD